jgi:hypothetical protein
LFTTQHKKLPRSRLKTGTLPEQWVMYLGPQLPYEEGIHVPLIICHPAGVSGVTASQPVLNNDLIPIFADTAMVELSHQADGMSLAPLLIDPGSSSWHRSAFLVERWFLPNLSKYQRPILFTLLLQSF